eukprot:scaffold2395_cov290-Prasinococcus_capsulatus_cf.AAC.4
MQMSGPRGRLLEMDGSPSKRPHWPVPGSVGAREELDNNGVRWAVYEDLSDATGDVDSPQPSPPLAILHARGSSRLAPSPLSQPLAAASSTVHGHERATETMGAAKAQGAVPRGLKRTGSSALHGAPRHILQTPCACHAHVVLSHGPVTCCPVRGCRRPRWQPQRHTFGRCVRWVLAQCSWRDGVMLRPRASAPTRFAALLSPSAAAAAPSSGSGYRN